MKQIKTHNPRKKETLAPFKTMTEIAAAYGKTPQWIAQLNKTRKDFPQKREDGTWDRAAIAEYFSGVLKAQSLRMTGDKAKKTALECSRLEVVIKREKEMLAQQELETARMKAELIKREDVRKDDEMRARTMRQCIEAWRQHEGAKTPALATAVDALVDSLLERLRELEYART